MKDISTEVSEKALKEMCNDEFKGDFSNMLRSRSPLFYITTNEESRLIQFLDHYCTVKGYDCFLWDCYYGLVRLSDRKAVGGTTDTLKANPEATLDYIIGESKNYENTKSSVKDKQDKHINGVIYVLLDFFRFITDNPDYERRLKAVADVSSIVSTIVTGPYYHSTDVLSNLMPVLDFPLANKNEIGHALRDVAEGASCDIPDIVKKTKKMKEDLVNAASGLTLVEAQAAFSKSLVSHRDWDIPTILKEKKQIISKNGMLEYFDNTVSMKDVGGLKRLVGWIKDRKATFSDEAAVYGLKKPKGLLLLGLPGTGKSLVCKAISSEWGMPLLRLDFGKLFGSLVGKSEENIRAAIKLAESIAPCVSYETLIDLEKKQVVVGELYDTIKEGINDGDIGRVIGIDKNTEIGILNHPVKIKSFSKETNKIVDNNLNAIIKRKVNNKKIYKVTLRNGQSIKVSEDHKFLVVDSDSNKIWKSIKDIKVKERIITM